jgi:hypothetical protein
VLVEPRNHPLLHHVIHQFESQLDKKKWCFHIFHGNLNQQAARHIASNFDNRKRINLSNLNVSDLKPKDIAYNRLLTSPEFW